MYCFPFIERKMRSLFRKDMCRSRESRGKKDSTKRVRGQKKMRGTGCDAYCSRCVTWSLFLFLFWKKTVWKLLPSHRGSVLPRFRIFRTTWTWRAWREHDTNHGLHPIIAAPQTTYTALALRITGKKNENDSVRILRVCSWPTAALYRVFKHYIWSSHGTRKALSQFQSSIHHCFCFQLSWCVHVYAGEQKKSITNRFVCIEIDAWRCKGIKVNNNLILWSVWLSGTFMLYKLMTRCFFSS